MKSHNHLVISGHEGRGLWLATMMVFLTMFFSANALAGVAVVVSTSSNVDTLSESQVRNVFLGKIKALPNGESAVPVNQLENSKAYEAFIGSVLKKSHDQLTQYWARRVFSGKGSPPQNVAGDSAVKLHVKNVSGGIGYIMEESVDNSVKVIYRSN